MTSTEETTRTPGDIEGRRDSALTFGYMAGLLALGTVVIDIVEFDDSPAEVAPNAVVGLALLAGTELYRRRTRNRQQEPEPTAG